MEKKTYIDSFLLEQFKNFYIELLSLKNKAQSGSWVYDLEETVEKNNEGEAISSGLVFQKLVTLLEEQELKATKTGGEFGAVLFNEVKYIMAVYCDEVFLSIDWIGKESWSQYLLETKFFGSNAGGENFYIRLEKIIQERDPVFSEVANIFLIILSLGFRGQYFGRNDEGKIEYYKEQLFSFVFQVKPDSLLLRHKIFPNAYNHVLKTSTKSDVPGIKYWWGIFGTTVISLFGISHIIWTQLTEELELIINQIIK